MTGHTSASYARLRKVGKWPVTRKAKWLIGASTLMGLSMAGTAMATPKLVLNNVGNPTSQGSGSGKRAIWTNAGTVGSETVDIVGVITSASLDHQWTTTESRPSITSAGQDNVFISWHIYRAGTYKIASGTGGIPIVADIHVQFNDVDGPNNERIYAEVCAGDIQWVRIDASATTGRSFGTVAGRDEVFSLNGDKDYKNQPESGLEIFWPNRSSFDMGRTANSQYFIRLDNPTYNEFNTLDFECGDFSTPVAVDDAKQGVLGDPTTIQILNNDSGALNNNNPTNNNLQLPSEFARDSVSLQPPAVATDIVRITRPNGTQRIIGFKVAGEGTWAFDTPSGGLTFTPEPTFRGEAASLAYTYSNALGVTSQPATVTVWYPAIGLTKSATFNDENADGYMQVGETISYVYNVRAYGREALSSPTIVETGFTGNGTTPVPTYQSGDSDADNKIGLTETWTYTATYALVAADLAMPHVSNSATATGKLADNTVVSDVSDSALSGDGDGSAYSGPGPKSGDPTKNAIVKTPISAAADSNSAAIYNGIGQANAYNVLSNDRLNGVSPTIAKVTLTVITPASHAGVTLDSESGQVSVAANTPAGTYSIAYKICEIGNPSNCANATATVIVSAPKQISAATDTPTAVVSYVGGNSIINALSNDRFDAKVASIADVTLKVTSAASHAGVTLDIATGLVSVAAGTPAGSYAIGYSLCETANPTNCAAAVINITVSANPIAASNDTPASKASGPAYALVVNAFANDTLKNAAALLSEITARVTSEATPVRLGAPVPTLDPSTGVVSVPAGTPAGTYTIGYEICEKADPDNCATASITVVLAPAPIVAANDTAGSVYSARGGSNIHNVLGNDTLASAAVSLSTVSLTVKTAATHNGVSLNTTTGLISVAPETPAGNYTLTYSICEKLNPENCANADVSVVVTTTPLTTQNDTPPAINGRDGSSAVGNAFSNDLFNGQAVDPSKLDIAITTTPTPVRVGAPVPELDIATGVISVPQATPAGEYVIGYTICEPTNPTNCATSTITVVVTASAIVAAADEPNAVNGANGGNDIINIFANDTLNGDPIDLDEVTATILSPATPKAAGANVPQVDIATGLVDVPANTPAGEYIITYKICENLNPANCSTNRIKIVVTAPKILAVADEPSPVNGADGSDDIINIFVNDTLNGAPINMDEVTATILSPATPKVAGANVPEVDPATGLVDVPANTPAGEYIITYKICENLNPANCSTTNVVIVVSATEIEAVADAPAPVRSGIGNAELINAFANDLLNGSAAQVSKIIATITQASSHSGVLLDPATGNVSVNPDVPAGSYVIAYRICEALNPQNCADSRVTIVVEPALSVLEGTVYTDLNSDKALAVDEPRRAGWIVEVVKDGKVISTATTDSDGHYRIAELVSGPGYDIRFRSPGNNVLYSTIKDVDLKPNTSVSDMNQPIDPSGIIYDSITRQPVSGATAIFTDRNEIPLPAACFVDQSQAQQVTGSDGGYRFDIIPGAAPQCPPSETIYKIKVVPPAGYSDGSSVFLPLLGPFDPTGMIGPVRIYPEPTIPTSNNPPFYLDFRLASGDPDIVNNHIALDPFLTRAPLFVTKTSIKRTASVGDIIPYEITVRNNETAQRAGVSVVDILPAGTKYVAGSSSVNGTAQEPVANDRTLEWRNQIIPANGSMRYNLAVVIGAGITGGEKVNTGVAQNGADGQAISNRSSAVVSIVPSAVFDCSELLGKVFEDRNRNGYQDEGEPGVPSVRLATVNGHLITTDAFGRYHIACAAVPDARIGSNLVLKIDTRTLPLGWTTTTDNPRSIRLTRGKFGELNFGVAPEQPNATGQEKGE